MPNGIQMNRSAVDLPMDVAQEILQKVQEESIVQRLARRITVPGRGVAIPVITGDPEPQWVAETDKKPVGTHEVGRKIIQPHKLALIEPFSNEFARDYKALYDAMIARLPRLLGEKFDKTVFFGPSSPLVNFDDFATVSGVGIDEAASEPKLYDGLVNAEAAVNAAGGMVTGYAMSYQGRAELLRATDATNRPLFAPNLDGRINSLLGAPLYFSRAAYKDGDATNADVIGFAGDWSHAAWGTVEGVRAKYSDQATLTYNDGTDDVTINLFQQNMFAVLIEIEIGFACEPEYFARLTREHAGA